MLIKVLFAFVACVAMTNAFAFDVFGAFKADPVLSKFAAVKTGEQFKVRLDIGQDETSPHMYLDGLCIEMVHDVAKKNEVVGMPGADGPHPQTSTGTHVLNVLSHPFFIDIFGKQKVRFEKAAWEMIWKKDNHCGSIICGFDVPVGAKRNDANLPPGRIYLTFPVWSQAGLAIRQAERSEAETKVKTFSIEKNEEMQKYYTETNLFKKAMHYRNVAAAVEKIDMTGVRWLSQIPTNSEVISIGNDLLLNIKGQVWQKETAFFGANHKLLGTAVLSPLVEESKDNILRP
jgi:hypothetical protein